LTSGRFGLLDIGGTGSDVTAGKLVSTGASWIDFVGSQLVFQSVPRSPTAPPAVVSPAFSPTRPPVASPSGTPTRTATATSTASVPAVRTPTPTATATVTATPSGPPARSGAAVSRLYIRTEAPSFAPAPAGQWNITPGTNSLLGVVPGALGYPVSALESAGGAVSALLVESTSEPLAAGSRWGGTVTWAMGALAQSADANMYWHAHIWLTQGDSSAVRCTLLGDYEESGSNAWPVAPMVSGPVRPPALAGCPGWQAGDRIVVELGYVARNTLTSGRFGLLDIGGTGSDVTAGKLASTGVSWIDFVGSQLNF